MSSGATDYLDLIKYTQSYIKGFIKDYIDLIFIRHDIGFIYMDFNIFIYMDAVWYEISIIVETSIKISILRFWYGCGGVLRLLFLLRLLLSLFI